MSYLIEFPDFDDAPAAAALLALGFDDASWHNEICPSFHHRGAGIMAWVDFVDPSKREYPEESRFALNRVDETGASLERTPSLIHGDDWPEFLAAIHAQLIARTFADLLAEALSHAQWVKMQALNASAAYAGDSCASHDFCDANEIMDDAFTGVMGRPAQVEAASDETLDPADVTLWSAAWAIAKARYLTEGAAA